MTSKKTQGRESVILSSKSRFQDAGTNDRVTSIASAFRYPAVGSLVSRARKVRGRRGFYTHTQRTRFTRYGCHVSMCLCFCVHRCLPRAYINLSTPRLFLLSMESVACSADMCGQLCMAHWLCGRDPTIGQTLTVVAVALAAARYLVGLGGQAPWIRQGRESGVGWQCLQSLGVCDAVQYTLLLIAGIRYS